MHHIDIVDNNDNIIGTGTVKDAHARNLMHRASVVYLINELGAILVQVRADDGRHDHSAAGHVDQGESYLDAAKRELREELGVEVEKLDYLGKTSRGNHFFEVYYVKANPGKLQQEEVTDVYWAEVADVKKDMVANPNKYSGGFKSSIELLSKINLN